MVKLLAYIDEIHTTQKGADRIKKNLKLNIDDISAINAYCQSKIADKNCRYAKRGKNYYCKVDDIRLTINSSSYTIITAHIIKAEKVSYET